jgi:hypothetical protein
MVAEQVKADICVLKIDPVYIQIFRETAYMSARWHWAMMKQNKNNVK